MQFPFLVCLVLLVFVFLQAARCEWDASGRDVDTHIGFDLLVLTLRMLNCDGTLLCLGLMVLMRCATFT